MGRYIGANCRKCRTVAEKLFLKNKKCYTAKCILERRASKPGQHGKTRKKVSEYSLQLTEKQKLKLMYGMMERQFRHYFEEAARMKGITGNNLLIILEKRLDNVIMRAGFASSRKQARQYILHGHIKVNGHKVDIPSFLVSEKDKIEIKAKEKTEKMIKAVIESNSGRPVPSWINTVADKLLINIERLPKADDMDNKINVQLIVELYSK